MLINQVPYYSFLAVAYMSIFASVIGYLVHQMSIKQIGPSKTSIFINLVPIFSIVLSVTILKENISGVKLLTALLIITGVYICQKN
jgi:drug/metabolite transporter (DMT)-like permease